jgi:hypothetical protein
MRMLMVKLRHPDDNGSGLGDKHSKKQQVKRLVSDVNGNPVVKDRKPFESALLPTSNKLESEDSYSRALCRLDIRKLASHLNGAIPNITWIENIAKEKKETSGAYRVQAIELAIRIIEYRDHHPNEWEKLKKKFWPGGQSTSAQKSRTGPEGLVIYKWESCVSYIQGLAMYTKDHTIPDLLWIKKMAQKNEEIIKTELLDAVKISRAIIDYSETMSGWEKVNQEVWPPPKKSAEQKIRESEAIKSVIDRYSVPIKKSADSPLVQKG